jgi:hypothetical protein
MSRSEMIRIQKPIARLKARYYQIPASMAWWTDSTWADFHARPVPGSHLPAAPAVALAPAPAAARMQRNQDVTLLVTVCLHMQTAVPTRWASVPAWLEQIIREGRLQGIKVCPNAPTMSHFLFADDSLILFRANGWWCTAATRYYKSIWGVFGSDDPITTNLPLCSVLTQVKALGIPKEWWMSVMRDNTSLSLKGKPHNT